MELIIFEQIFSKKSKILISNWRAKTPYFWRQIFIAFFIIFISKKNIKNYFYNFLNRNCIKIVQIWAFVFLKTSLRSSFQAVFQEIVLELFKELSRELSPYFSIWQNHPWAVSQKLRVNWSKVVIKPMGDFFKDYF